MKNNSTDSADIEQIKWSLYWLHVCFMQSLCTRWIALARARAKTVFSHLNCIQNITMLRGFFGNLILAINARIFYGNHLNYHRFGRFYFFYTLESVSSAIQTLRILSKILRCASHFQLPSRCSENWSNTVFCLLYITKHDIYFLLRQILMNAAIQK